MLSRQQRAGAAAAQHRNSSSAIIRKLNTDATEEVGDDIAKQQAADAHVQ